MAEIGVIGSGSWGTALALVLNKNGHHVTIFVKISKYRWIDGVFQKGSANETDRRNIARHRRVVRMCV